MKNLFWLLWLVSSLAVAAPENVVPAPLVLAGQELFIFRNRVGSWQPAERVKMISQRLERLSSDFTFDLNTISTREDEQGGWQVLAGDQILMVVNPEDAKYEKRPARVIADYLAGRIREILEEDRKRKSPRELLVHGIYALLYTTALAILLMTLSVAFRRLNQRIEVWKGTLIRPVQIKTFEILSAERMTRIAVSFLGGLRLVLTVGLVYFYLTVLLSLFPWTAHLAPKLLAHVLNPLTQIFDALVAFVPNFFFIAISLLVTRTILKVFRLFFSEIEKGSVKISGFYEEWAEPTYQLVRILVVAFSLVVIFPYLPGSGSPAFQGVSVFLGVIVSFGSTSAIANVIAGLVLTYMRAFRVGDRVEIGGAMGDIVEKSLLTTRIRTVKNVDIAIPNSVVLGGQIKNFSSSAKALGLILHTDVTIGYDAPWKKVHELLISAALKTESVLSSPAPFVLQASLEDSYVRYEINAYTSNPSAMALTYSALRQNIQDAFNQAGVEIMSPSYSALRDGNTTTIPPEHRPSGYESPSFRF